MSTQPIEPTPAPVADPTPAPAPAAPAAPPVTDPPPTDPPTDPAEPKPTETVEYWKQRSRQNEQQARTNADAAKRLKEIEDRDLSDLDKAKRDAAEATARADKIEQTALRQRIALEKGIPASLVSRLQGSTEEELTADADALMALVKAPPASPRPDPAQGPRPSTPQAEADAEYEQYFPPQPTTRK